MEYIERILPTCLLFSDAPELTFYRLGLPAMLCINIVSPISLLPIFEAVHEIRGAIAVPLKTRANALISLHDLTIPIRHETCNSIERTLFMGHNRSCCSIRAQFHGSFHSFAIQHTLNISFFCHRES